MHKFFTPKELISENIAKIIGEDVKHIIKVLRIEAGEKVVLNDCQGTEYLAVISSTSKQEVEFEILEKLDVNNESPVKIHLYQGLPKAQKMDLIVQKGTELGISDFIPVITLRVDVTEGEYGIWDDTIYVDYEYKDENESKILEDDIITLYGEFIGEKSYTSVLGAKITLPHINAKYIVLN